ncbi:hypothetical protein SO802_019070 [Lithocarpus litseifolius]|uniref:Uncharacterized protein n=1 Tax=Lithocarpus litseifolius TaxID=425828 RepID=A0AAW2CPY1_9ROSI
MSGDEDEDDEGEGERESDEDKNDNDEEALKSTLGNPRDDRPFILPKIWTINNFLPTMSNKVFGTLRDRYQIPDNIPIRLPGKFEKCYSGKTADVDMYDAMFAVRLRLPLTALHPSVHPHITGEQEAFIRRVTKILLDEQRCRDLITLDTLHLYCEGPETTLVARKLNAYSS